MSHTNPTLSAQEKQAIKQAADAHIQHLNHTLQTQVDYYAKLAQAERDSVPKLQQFDLGTLAESGQVKDEVLAKIYMYEDNQIALERIQAAPYFLRLDVTWKDTNTNDTIYIGKYAAIDYNIYSWIAPISQLRYSGIGESNYLKPDGNQRDALVSRKDDFIINNAEIVFMTHESDNLPRQVIYQKHMDERREFMLPEIVAELDRLQDQIIRSNPEGPFLISGPAGSGKTTLALHRIAYLVLTPEFKDFFKPERIMVFVADQGAVNYFSNLLPELGINGVKITTFMDWAVMIANSRFKSTVRNRFKGLTTEVAIEFIKANNPLPELHPRHVWDLYRKIKQEIIMALPIKEGSQVMVYPALKRHYFDNLTGLDEKLVQGFKKYWQFLETNKYLDEVDLTILLHSLENPPEPFVHLVIDEVQNWLPEQLQIVTSFVSRLYKSITFIGDIRQKTKAFSVQDWAEINSEFAETGPRKVELLKVYRNTKPILQHLADLGYDVDVSTQARNGVSVELLTDFTKLSLDERQAQIKHIIQQTPATVQIGILAKYSEQLADYALLGYDHENVHVLTIEQAQGLEFHTVILLEPQSLHTSLINYTHSVGYTAAEAFVAQDRHLYYVAVTRAQQVLWLLQ
jgi:DNA helicase IV